MPEPSGSTGAALDARIAQLEAENEKLRQELQNAWLLIYRPASAFLAAEPWRRHIADLKLIGPGYR